MNHDEVLKPALFPILQIDLGRAVNYDHELKIIRSRLSRAHLFHNANLYRGITASKIPLVVERGTDILDRTTTFCHTWEAFEQLRSTSQATALDYAYDHNDPALIVYDGKSLSPDIRGFDKVSLASIKDQYYRDLIDHGVDVFRFLTDPRDAVVAILRIRN